MRYTQGAAFGLSFFCFYLCLLLSAQASILTDSYQPLVNELPAKAEFKAGWVGFSERKKSQEFLNLSADTSLRAGRFGELWITLALLNQLQQQKISLKDPVNFYLNDFQLLQTQGDIQLDHLLSRQSGLALRQSNLYLSDPVRIPTLRDSIVQELKPAILPPGEIVTYQSVGDLVGAQLLVELVSQSRNRVIPLSEILLTHFAPLGWQQTTPFLAKTGQAYQAALSASAPGFADFPAAWSTAPEVHGYLTSLADLSQFLQALLTAQPPFSPLRQQQLLQSKAGEPSLGLFTGRVGTLDYKYMDSRLFGQTLRLVVFPEHQTGFVLYYNHSNPDFAAAFTQHFAQQHIQPALRLETSSGEDTSVSESSTYLRLATRDQVSLLTVLDILSPQKLAWTDTQLSYRGQHWQRQGNTSVYQNPWGEQVRWSDQQLQELGADQALWYPAKGWHQPRTQWAIAVFFLLCFAGFLSFSARGLWQYEPVVLSERDEHEEQDAGLNTEALSAEELMAEEALTSNTNISQESWDLPLLSAVNSFCVVAFFPLFYFGFVGTRLGAELTIAFRNQPTPMLIAGLVVPLFALVSAFILTLLLLSDWKARAWRPGHKYLYLSQVALVILFLSWLASWNLLGFRF
jgi:hypothetical protein